MNPATQNSETSTFRTQPHHARFLTGSGISSRCTRDFISKSLRWTPLAQVSNFWTLAQGRTAQVAAKRCSGTRCPRSRYLFHMNPPMFLQVGYSRVPGLVAQGLFKSHRSPLCGSAMENSASGIRSSSVLSLVSPSALHSCVSNLNP